MCIRAYIIISKEVEDDWLMGDDKADRPPLRIKWREIK